MKRGRTVRRVVGFLLGIVLALVFFSAAVIFSFALQVKKEPLKYGMSDEPSDLNISESMYDGMQIPLLGGAQFNNVLLIGCDNRGSEKYSRADSIMIFSQNIRTHCNNFISLQRALYVDIPDQYDPEFADFYSPQYMLNAAHTWGGGELLLKTVRRNFRVDVRHYIEVDFTGFEKLIDAVGGITVELSADETAYLLERNHPDVHEGNCNLDGKTALEYARMRYTDSDFGRMFRQRQVMAKLFAKAKSYRIFSFMKAMAQNGENIKTDMTSTQLTFYLLRTMLGANNKIRQLTLPLEKFEAMTYIDGMEMYTPDWVSNINALHDFMQTAGEK